MRYGVDQRLQGMACGLQGLPRFQCLRDVLNDTDELVNVSRFVAQRNSSDMGEPGSPVVAAKADCGKVDNSSSGYRVTIQPFDHLRLGGGQDVLHVSSQKFAGCQS